MKIKSAYSLAMAATMMVTAIADIKGEVRDADRLAGRPSVGLVLSGGGAKGIAHAGVIKALEENDIPIDCIAGTSMGAVVGSLYSCGWSPERMMSFFTSTKFLDCSTGTIDPALTYYFSKPAPTPQWLDLNFSFKKQNSLMDEVLPGSLINPLPMSIEFLELFTPYTAKCRGNFNSLFVPFRCVTSDIYHKHKIVLDHGSLGDAVRASMSFPLVFKPIEMDGVLVYDGGIYDNFPVDVMESDFDPDFIIGVSVSAPDSKPVQGNIYEQLEDMIIQNNDYTVPADRGIKIQVPVLDFGVLDFTKGPEIFDIGYKTGLAMVDSIKKRTPARRRLTEVTARRKYFSDALPVIEYDSVKVEGTSGAPARYLEFLCTRGLDKPFGMEQVQNAFYRAVAGGEIADLLPQTEIRSYDPATVEDVKGVNRTVLDKNTLVLKTSVKNPWNLGVGGWITSSTNSMLYLTVGYHTLAMNSLAVNLSGWIGQTYYAGMLDAKFTLHSRVPSCLEFQGVLSRQKYYDTELLFYQDATPSFITDNEHFIRVNYAAALGRAGKVWGGTGYGYLYDRYYPDKVTDYAHAERDRSRYRIWCARGGVEWNTLNNQLYPSDGHLFNLNIAACHEDASLTPGEDPEPGTVTSGAGVATGDGWTGHWNGSLELQWKHFFTVHPNFIVGGAAHGLVTLENLYQNYTATLVHSYAFAPTPSTRNYFNPAFRSNNFVAAGVMPVWSPMDHVQLRGDFYLYAPVRDIKRGATGLASGGGWFRRTEFVGEVAAVYNFNFASLSLYGNYLSYPARNWNFGINFGLYFQAPRFIR